MFPIKCVTMLFWRHCAAGSGVQERTGHPVRRQFSRVSVFQGDRMNTDLKMSLLTTVGALVMIMVFSFVAVLN
ncbi:MAG: YnhF family membrane protein [Candidatus Symbiopectobacterium sp. Dall1.0]|nr:YnhF family membrane protein [Candidatus Symbiopectobacterium sp. Dall1.0]